MATIFLSYAKEDKDAVQGVYRALRSSGLNPWMDSPPIPDELEGIQPGEDWDSIIRRKLREAEVTLVFFSKTSIKKQGYVQREYRLALSMMMEKPPESIYLIPVLLEECAPPDIRVDTVNLRQFQWYKLYEDGVGGLVNFLKRKTKGGNSRDKDLGTSSDPETIAAINRAMMLAGDYKYKFEMMSREPMLSRTSWRRQGRSSMKSDPVV